MRADAHRRGSLDLDRSRVAHVFNKVDLLPDVDAFRQGVVTRFPDALCVSAVTGRLSELEDRLVLLAAAGRNGARAAGS